MGSSLIDRAAARHRELPEMRREMVKADLRKPENRDFQAEIGACVRSARQSLGWSLKEFAGHLQRDERQVARWEDGKERPQFDALFALESLRGPLVIHLATLSEQIQIETTISIRRSA